MIKKIGTVIILSVIILGLFSEIYPARAETIRIILPSQVTVKNWKEIYPAD